MAAAATPGVGSLLVGGGLSFLPGLLSALFGGDPRERYRQAVKRLLRERPEMIAKLYQAVQSSPAFAQAQGSIAAGGNTTANTLAANLGARGIGTTGTGAVLSSLVPSIVGNQQAQLRTSAYGAAQSQADSDIRAQLEALAGTSGPGQTSQLFGAGLGAFGPMLSQWLQSKYPTTQRAA